MKSIFQLGAMIFVILTLLLYVFQRHLMYYPSQEVPSLSAYDATDMQVINLQTADGLSLRSWYRPAAPHQPTVLYLHGNAGHIGHRVYQARQLMDAGFGILLLEYRGYGGNQGHPTEEGLYEDARAGMRFLQQKSIPPAQVVLYGESLGTGVATKLATEYRVCAVILQSPYTSFSALARYHYPWVFLSPWDKYDSLQRIQSVHAPLLVLHGEKDDIVPYAQGKALFQQANAPKKMRSFKQAGHHALWSIPGFSDNLVNFIHQYCAVAGTVAPTASMTGASSR